MTHRALIGAALAEGTSRVLHPLRSDDTEATRRVLTQLGARITRRDDGWKVEGGGISTPRNQLFCGESGTTLRLVTPITALAEGDVKLTGGPSLSGRPMEPLLEGLRQLGVRCESTDGYPPITVRGLGRIKGGEARIRGDISSQFVSGILLIAPLTEEGTSLRLTTPLESKPYVEMTLDALDHYGVKTSASQDLRSYHIDSQSYHPADYEVEGDWSSASFMMAAGALSGDLMVQNLRGDSRQADRAIINILSRMGAEIITKKGYVKVRKSYLQPITTNLKNSPDLFPTVAALCACAQGRSILMGVRRLRFKESDRIAAMTDGLGRMGIKVEEEGDRVIIEGGNPEGAVVDPYNDHRIAMALGVLALTAEGETRIRDAECVSKSYPTFWKRLEGLGARITRVHHE
jgi:3-phosphoshikimate 1-carboxyvinyltransferase